MEGIHIVIDSTKSHPTYDVHWFPASNQKEGTMFQENGPLHKYDNAFGTNAKEFEEIHFQRDSDWEGHCDKAAIVISMFKEPKKNVVVNGITFTPYDIKGLLVKVVHSFPFRREWVGSRYPYEDASDPRPRELYTKLKDWTKLRIPVIFDVDAFMPVWMFAFDQVIFDFDEGELFLKSTGQPGENRKYTFDWKLNRWTTELGIGDKSRNPDIAWIILPEVDLYDRENWPVENGRNLEAFLNTHVSPKRVFDIYIQSLE